MSSYLMFRTIVNREKTFFDGAQPRLWDANRSYVDIHDSVELEDHLRRRVHQVMQSGKKYALALSGGIDSAILAKFMPAGSKAYTFKCVVPGVQVTDETPQAARYAAECGLEHEVVEIYWEDFEKYAPLLMKHKGAPMHSIEVQIYKAALRAKADGFDGMLFGESADGKYGGMSGLLSKDWTLGEFVNRYSYVLPYMVLRDFELIVEPYVRHMKADGRVEVHEFMNDVFFKESIGSYANATDTAGMELCCPFSETMMAVPLDYERIRRGENKYLVREIFNRLYPGWETPAKVPMPRPMNEWFARWEGPTRPEFYPHCTDNMTGDQKWLVWALEQFLNSFES